MPKLYGTGYTMVVRNTLPHQKPMSPARSAMIAVGATLAGLQVSCEVRNSAPERVVVLCSVDETFAREILNRFGKEYGIEVAAIYDSEAGKTTGLVNRIIGEAKAGRPTADVFWSGEIFATLRLAELGMLEPYESPAAADIPENYRDLRHRWTALGVRARVLAFDPSKISAERVPEKWEDLARPEIARHTAMANPLFGTTRGHVAAMFALWGPQQAREYLIRLRENGVLMLDGNSATVRAVIDGRAQFAWTDSDDVWVARGKGASIDSRMLDMGDGGALLIPCSVAVVRGGPNPAVAKKLADYLVSADVERMLARSDSRNIPVREPLRRELGLDWPTGSKVSFEAVKAALDESDAAVREILIR